MRASYDKASRRNGLGVVRLKFVPSELPAQEGIERAPEAAFRAPGVLRARRERRVVTVFCESGADLIVDEARALNPVSVDVAPVTLKEIFLEAVAGAEE